MRVNKIFYRFATSKSNVPTVVLATNNRHKVIEIRAIVKKAGVRVRFLTLDDFPKKKPVVENKPTIEGNAIKKAREVAKRTGCLALADDTGLFVHVLKGKPGVYSARFAGPGCSYEDNNKKLLSLLQGKTGRKRSASFRCVAALASPDGRVVTAEGRVEGHISEEVRGRHGFGYDPVFVVRGTGKTFAQMGSRIKNKVSHRSKAFRQVPHLLRRLLGQNN